MTNETVTGAWSAEAANRFGASRGLGEASALLGVLAVSESMGHVVRDLVKFEDSFWGPMNGAYEEKGISLEELGDLIKYTEKQVKVNSVIGKGHRLRSNYVFGRGYELKADSGDIKPRYRKIIDRPTNRDAVFSEGAMRKINRSLFTAGNVMVMYDRSNSTFSRIPLSMIKNAFTDLNDGEKVKYYLVKFTEANVSTGAIEKKRAWIPTDTYLDSVGRKGLPASMSESPKSPGEKIPVSRTQVIVDLRVNLDAGDTWGVPDCLPALPWAWAYSEYLKDGTKLLKALATIAYQVKAKTQEAQAKAGADIRNAPAGSAAITGVDTEIKEIPRGSAVDLYAARPILANAANALDVSVTAISSDTGKGGAYGSEVTLTLPEQLSALARQKEFSEFYRRLFDVMGADDVSLVFNRLAVDPIHRQMQSLGLARTFGGVSQIQYRKAAMELLDIAGDVNDLPEPDEWTGSKVSSLREVVEKQIEADDKADAAARQAQDPNARQGNSGAVGSVTDDNDARNSDKTD